jgi:hypothetical protein
MNFCHYVDNFLSFFLLKIAKPPTFISPLILSLTNSKSPMLGSRQGDDSNIKFYRSHNTTLTTLDNH